MKTVIIKAELIKETPAAWLLNCEGDEVWFPKSQVKFNKWNSTVEVPTWLMDEKNLCY